MVDQAKASETAPPKIRSTNTAQRKKEIKTATPIIESQKERPRMPDPSNGQNPQAKERRQTAQEKLDSYYADKDLAWWIELARDFKRATKVPLPDENEVDI
jgi:hypothetical protein